jgi:hypothetical protein
VVVIVVALISAGRTQHSMVLLTMLKIISLDYLIKDGNFWQCKKHQILRELFFSRVNTFVRDSNGKKLTMKLVVNFFVFLIIW